MKISKQEQQLVEQLDRNRMPGHVAIIMDGNGRWAAKHGLPRIAGHYQGRKSVKNVLQTCLDYGIPIVTLYAFSSENWKRPRDEVFGLMNLIETAARQEIDEMHRKGTRFQIIGRLNELPDSLRNELQREMELTKNNTNITLNLAINYGGRTEVVDAARRMAEEYKDGKLSIDDIDEKRFSNYMYYGDLPDPDIIIRTGGDLRISNFLLWESAYSEFWITDTLWPDFGRVQFLKAIIDFQNRERRFGGTVSRKGKASPE